LNHCFEHIFHLTKDCNQSIDKLSVGVPFQDKSNLEKFGHTQDLRCAGDVWFIPYETVANAKLHPAAYPVELPKRCIQLAGLGKDAVVLDRFCGSGTTLVACKILNVSGLGFEKSARYVEITKQRLAKTRIQLFGV
jgi:site-specific DNA-methyltransferase (adenine-specific)